MHDNQKILHTNSSQTNLSEWKNKKIAVIGLGLEGLATLRFLAKKGISVYLLDKKEKHEIDHDIYSEIEGLATDLIMGDDYLKDLTRYDILIRSPGVKALLPELIEAKEHGVLVTSHINIFFDLCPCPVIGITGTKGKGTTASLLYKILQEAEKDAYLGGNIGQPPLDFLDTLNAQSVVVLELSSFQLQDIKISPHIAVMLMITSEHLDYHNDISEYVDAKRNLLRFQKPGDFAILNRDYPATNESDVYTDGKVFFVSREREPDEGCFTRDESIWIRRDGEESMIIDCKQILLPGSHNIENVCAAVMAATLTGVSKEAIVKVLKSFTGLEHRLELIKEVNEVRYYDDSFSTIPEAAIAAIHAFTQPEILILGGSSKNSDFLELGTTISRAKNVKAIIGIGDEWERIKAEIRNPDVDILFVESAKDMQTIVQAAAKIASPGDVVILSPACASFDMFKSYKDRGEQFKKEVEKLG